MKLRSMLKRFFALVVTVASFQVAMAQSSVTGKVTDQSTGAALANAVFDATGVRFRRLPLTPDRVKQGLQKL